MEAGPGDIERYLRKPNWLEKQIRAWAEKLNVQEQQALTDENSRSLDRYEENNYRLHHLKKEFERVSDPGFEGTAAAIKLICRHYFDLLPQPF